MTGEHGHEAVVCTGVVKIYETETSRVQAVKGVDLRIGPSDVVAISGPSGSGKSSLLRMVAGLSTPTAGTISVAGVDLASLGPLRRRRERRRLITHVEQRPADNLLPHLSVRDQLNRLAYRRNWSVSDAQECLSALGLEHRLDHFPDSLSGGEQQRLAFARAAISSTALVVADEPTAELDAVSASQVVDAARTIAERGVAVLIATHDPRVVDRVDVLVELRDGAVAARTDERGRLAVIDGSGRLQLPADARAEFPDGYARVVWDQSGDFLRVERP